VTYPGFSRQPVSTPRRIRPLEPDPPRWVHELLDGGTGQRCDGRPYSFDVIRRDPFMRITAKIPGAALLAADELSRCVTAQYAALESLLANLERVPIRIWNYIPGIVESMEPGLDRYMAFNRGRYRAYADWWGIEQGLECAVPTASAVGITGPDLVIDCLASAAGGSPVDNPRQTASWRYSRRYGPLPPCFARGTVCVLDGRRMLLVGGTASIVGEESRHAGDVLAQAEEALANIEAVVARTADEPRAPLQLLTDARIYVVNGADAEMIEGLILARGARTLRVETVLARVCRQELLVEIEGLADVRAGGH
jgi:chorismate lyase/3-hydroxybenzoate synthase